jgi:outer membrane protein OmpA-like peptidoglycan-associated protein
MPIRIREVRIDDGTMDFTDLYVQPNFAAKITGLGGTLTGLSSDPASHANLDLKGAVGEFSPVTISGEVQLFAFERHTDVDLRFENISLPIFNPYSGQLAGYSIAKGKLTTDLHYLIQDRKLDAQHKIRIDQLEWGEETAAKGEATLPVKFATALLKDRNGVIELDVPVTGSIDDPKFRIGPIVWQVIKNILAKAVTAPFALLGSLFAGAEDAQFVDFAPGSTVLDPETAERLAALSKSLLERPAIKLDVPIGALPDIDRPALAARAFEQQLADAMAAVPAAGSKDGEPVRSFESLEPDDRIAVLSAMVRNQTGSDPLVPEPPAPPEGTSRGEAKALGQAATIAYLEKTARDAVTVPDTELEALGQERAAAVQRALLDGSALEPMRVFVTKSGNVTAHDGKVRLELALE